jgi:penicillin-binding protein 2
MSRTSKFRKTYDWSKQFETRLSFAVWLMVLVFVILLLRLWFLQIVNHKYYAALAEQNRLRTENTPALRGKICDRNGQVLARNRFSFAVFVDKKKLRDKKLFVKLAKVLNTTEGVLLRKAQKAASATTKNILIASDLTFAQVSYLKERKEDFPGVTIDYLALRFYPYRNLAAHVIGYVGEVSEEELKSEEFKNIEKGDIVGKTGIERVYDSYLRGEKGKILYEVDALGNIRRVVAREPAVSGKNVYLTIDLKIQQQAELALRKAIERAKKLGYSKANAGAAIVMEVNTGKILALASYPDFDPNFFVTGIDPDLWEQLTSPKNGYPLINRATKTGYAPGSTFKPLTLFSAFENGIIYAGEGFYCSGKWYGFGKRWPKSCWRRSGHGSIGLVRSLAESCDTVFYELGYRLYKLKGEPLQATAKKMNFGSKTGIEIGEVSGRVPDKKWKKAYFKRKENQIWLPGDTVNMAIGQGDLLVTPLQLLRFYAAIANGGKFYRPYLVEKVVDQNGKVLRENKPEISFKVNFNHTALKTVRTGLREVVISGTAQAAFAGFPVEVAGKTGTSQVYGKDDFSWFVGYAPADKPLYAVCVVIEQGGHGGEVAAPAVRLIMASLFDIPEKDLVKAVDTSR